MWYVIIVSVIAAYAAGLIYISFRCARFAFLRKFTRNRKAPAVLIAAVFFGLLTGLLTLLLNIVNAMIVMIHLYAFWLSGDLVSFAVSRIRHKKPARYYAGAIAAGLCAVYLAYGWISVHHVRQTEYSFQSSKLTEDVRIVQISDSHIGATFDAKGLLKYVEEINALEPDVVVVTGDFVDDDTSREDMLGGCDALGKLKTRYGVFFVWGNHDKGYYSEERRGWTGKELRDRLTENNVRVTEDEALLINDAFYIVGRLDRSDGGRKTASELLSGLDGSKYTVLLDHQPSDFDAEAEAGADLVLCGHTHGGQLIPVRYVGEWLGVVDLRYGHEKRGNTDFIVSSGISNWALRFKTGCFSEYVVIDLKAI